MHRVLVVEDDVSDIQYIKQILRPEYDVVALTSVEPLVEFLEAEKTDLILMKYNMPNKNGLEVLKELQQQKEWASIPVIILTEQSNAAIEAPCLCAGAKDFLLKPLVPEMVKIRVERIMELGELKKSMKRNLEENDRQVENVVLQAITTMANTVDAKDDYTGEHSIRVAEYSALIAREMGWSEDAVRDIHYLGLLHDIGKISVPDMIIRKPSSLNETEWRTMKAHTTIGADILKDIHIVKKASEVALYHHEWYNGTGYPTGAARENIPIEARIVCVADAYDAMTSNRVYRKALDMERVKAEFVKGKGTQFDPDLVEVVLRMIEEHKFDAAQAISFDSAGVHPGVAEESTRLLYRFMEVNNRESKLEAMKDPMTGLYNRTYAQRQITRKLVDEKRGVYMIVDLDNFKRINDTYGHLQGDGVLKCVADILLDHFTQEDMVCRIGGDEFCVFLDREMSRADIEDKCIAILNAYNRVVIATDQLMGSSLSIGIAVAPTDADTFEALYDAADKALYFAKRNGKNRYCFYEKEINPVTSDREIVIDIRQLEMIIHDRRNFTGSYQVEYQEFQRIYNFIARCVERTNQQVQLMMVSLKAQDKADPKVLEKEMCSLESAVAHSLRRNDVSTRYSQSQILVVLIDISEENMDIILQRVRENYEEIRKETCFELHFDKMQVEGRQDT